MIMTDILLAYVFLGCVGAMLSFIWLKTDAFVEYMRFFMLGSFMYVNEYKDMTANDPGTSYPVFLATNYNSFLTRMISCPRCLSIQFSLWLNVLAFIYLHIQFGGFVWLGWVFSTLITSYFTLSMYSILVRLAKHE